MKTTRTIAFLLLLSLALSVGTRAGELPAHEIFGLRLGMKADQAHKRMKEIAQFVRNERDQCK